MLKCQAMLKNYLKVGVRNLLKNRIFVFINVIGLGIALACCIVAYLNWDYNAAFDSYHTDTENVYRVNFIRNMGGKAIQNGSCPYPLAKAIEQNIPHIESVARYENVNGNFKVGDQIFRTRMAAVDPTFTEIFRFDLIEGNPSSFSQGRSMWISQELRRKYWPEHENVVGETLKYINGDEQYEFKVAAVFHEPPKNSSFQSQAFITYEALTTLRQWDQNNWAEFNSTFVKLSDQAMVKEIEAQLQKYVGVQNRAKEDYKVARYYLDPFVGMAVRAEKEDTWNHWFSQSLPSAAALAPAIMSVLLLFIACFNFTNTSIAIANRRIKEIGIRKVMGSKKNQIIIQFLGENLILTFLALLVGIFLAAFLVPLYSAMWVFLDIRFNLFENLPLLGFLITLLLFTALMAGSYPALYISRFEPTSIFRGSVKFSGTNFFTRMLLTLQFAFSLVAIVCGFVFSENAKFQAQYDMGFDIESVLYAYVGDQNGYQKYSNALRDIPQIKQIAGTRNNMTSSWYTDPIKVQSQELDVNMFDIGPGYLSTIGAEILAGRNFRENSNLDVENSVLINEELVKQLGWEDPINQKILLRDTIALNVVGMVKDIYNDGALWDPLDPMVMRVVSPEDYQFVVVRTDLKDIRQVKERMDEKWRTIFPNKISTVSYMEEEKAQSAEVNANIRALFIFLGFVAIILSVIGLFSMVSMNINKRLKEIGIRKILGASTAHIATKISREFILILLVAAAIGSAAGYLMADSLLSSIWAYYVPIKTVFLLMAVGTLILASIATIGSKILKASSTIPANMLRE